MEYLYGGNYYPLIEERENWERDLRTMKDCGINYVRTGEIFNGWDQLEPKEGVYRFAELNEFFDLCEKYEVKVLLGTGTNSPPVWLSKKDPTVNVLSSTGNRFPTNVTYGWACYNNPNMRQSSINYIKALVEYFKSHPALLGYQINNEIGYPFMPLTQGGALEDYCHCEHCQAKFRDWVQNKYKTIDALNHAYRWGATHQYHNSFDDVESPKAKPTSWASVTRWLDWRLFHMETITGQVEFENELLKSLDKEHITAVNIFYLKSQDPLAVTTALDQFSVARHADYIGYDIYPGSGDKLEKKPEFSSMFLDHGRSITRPLGKQLWLSEVEGGPIGGWILGPDRNTTGDDIVRNVMEALGHDIKSILYQLFKEPEFQPLHWGGVINLDGSTNERTEKVAKLGEFLHKNEDFIMRSQTRKGQVAILISKENEIIMNGVGHQQFFLEELRGTYKYYWSKGYHVDFITKEQLCSEYKEDYAVIHAPFLAVVDDEIANGIEDYVSKGGFFVTSARFSYMTKEGWYKFPMIQGELKDVLGLTMGEVEANTFDTIHYGDSELKGYWQKEFITSVTADIVATYSDQNPAITINQYKKGKAMYFTTHFGNEFLNGEGTLAKVLGKELIKNDCLPYVTVEHKGKEFREVDCHILEHNDKAMLIVTKYFNKEKLDLLDNGLTVRLSVKINANKLTDYSTGKNIAYTEKDDFITFEITMDHSEFYVIEVEKC